MNTSKQLHYQADSESPTDCGDEADTAVQEGRGMSDRWESATVLLMKPNKTLFYLSIHEDEPKQITNCPCVIGRSQAADFPLLDESVSRRHAVIDHGPDGTFVIRDDNSLNGTHIGDKAVGEQILVNGDEVKLGSIVVKFCTADSELKTNMAAPVNRSRLRTGLGDLLETSKARLERFNRAAADRAQVFVHSLRMLQHRWKQNRSVSPSARAQLVVPAALVACGIVLGLAWFAGTALVADSRVYAIPFAEPIANEPPSEVAQLQAVALTEPAPVPSMPAAEERKTNMQSPPAKTTTAVGTAVVSTTTVKRDEPKVATSSRQPVAVKRQPRQTADQVIEKARSSYVRGEFERAVILLTSGRWAGNAAVANTLAGLRAAFAEFDAGRKELEKGNESAAFGHWERFLVAESAMLPDGGKSHFARLVVETVVAEFTKAGDSASADERWHDAYANWSRAAALKSDSQATAGLLELEQRGKREYLAGYQLEDVQVARAIEHWQETRRLLPPHTEYHMKAKAKLQLYNVL